MASPSEHDLKRSKYRVLGLVGQGQFGKVYCAVHRRTGQLVALKNLEHQRFPTHKFLREFRFLLSLRHPNIVTCQAIEHTRTGRYLVMDYCEGGTLRNLMADDYPASHRTLPLAQSLKLIADILSGLEHAHNRGIVHCDIKPDNILLNLQPTGWIARISDFGIARLSHDLGDYGAGNTGSPAYMAPERFYGQYSPASDLYSVGILLFELMTGCRPFSGTPTELMSAHLNCPLKLPESIPSVCHPLLTTSLQKLAARRFRSAGEMLTVVRDIAAEADLELFVHDSILLNFPTTPDSAIEFQYQWSRGLKQPISQLEAQSLKSWTDVCWTMDSHITHQRLVASVHPHDETLACTATLTSPARELWLRPQGCITRTQQDICILPLASCGDGLIPQRVMKCSPDQLVAIAPQGQWLAIVTPSTHLLQIWTGASVLSSGSLKQPSVTLELENRTSQTVMLMAIDAHHVGVLSSTSGQGVARVERRGIDETGTYLEVLTRRGDRLGVLELPIQIGRAITTTTPYRLLATDALNPSSVLLIDIKPFRISRQAVGFVPQFLAAAPWGYVVANSQGRLMLLDHAGQGLGQITVPQGLTAIASVGTSGLMLATWETDRGHLYWVDLKQLAIELVF